MDNLVALLEVHVDKFREMEQSIDSFSIEIETLSDALIKIYNMTTYAGGDSRPKQVCDIARIALIETGRL
jgi:hypothetical protein